MTRAWLALLPALGGACTGPRAASTPWVVTRSGLPGRPPVDRRSVREQFRFFIDDFAADADRGGRSCS